VSSSPADILRRHGLKPKKDWGQNFLGDERILSQMAGLAGLTAEDTCVELGAGLGHYTRALAASGAQIIAVERDRELVPILKEEMKDLRVRVEEADAKSFALRPIAEAAGRKIVLVGNLPYHLSSPILFHLLDERASVKRGVFLLQREVAERIAAAPDTENFGLLSVLIGLHAEAEIGMRVGAKAFHPPPEVESAVLVLDMLEVPRAPVISEERFRVVVKAAFAQRRKTLSNALKAVPGGREGLEASGINPKRRGETLSVEEFASIERAIGPIVEPAKPL
jgi:16S rRNA (adenine1518-N6/adenine1519-N6)-dimethyltransferase